MSGLETLHLRARPTSTGLVHLDSELGETLLSPSEAIAAALALYTAARAAIGVQGAAIVGDGADPYANMDVRALARYEARDQAWRDGVPQRAWPSL
jgi:hypothetical protein